jgi:two-component system, LytTR family, response regulator
MPNTITAIIVDDEKPAREEMHQALKAYEQIQIIEQCKTATQALEAIETLQPDVVFLDIEMPPFNGLELVQRLNYLPEIIFCTAYNQFAIQAFEENALDYLLKPIQADRLKKAIDKLVAKLHTEANQDLRKKRLMLQNGNQYFLTNLSEIYLLEANGNYIKYYFKDRQVLKLGTLKNLEDSLPKDHFIKANRSQIINNNYIASIKDLGRNLVVHLHNGMQVKVSRSSTSDWKK